MIPKERYPVLIAFLIGASAGLLLSKLNNMRAVRLQVPIVQVENLLTGKVHIGFRMGDDGAGRTGWVMRLSPTPIPRSSNMASIRLEKTQ